MPTRQRLSSRIISKLIMYRYLHDRKIIVSACLLVLCVTMMALVGIYQWSLRPVDGSSSDIVRVVIHPGDGVSTIASKLQAAGVIRSAQSFRIYSELTGTKGRLQAGGYALAKNQSVADIIDHMSTGKTDEIDVTVLPGRTIADLKKDFAKKGFSESEINQAFSQIYSVPVLAEVPSGQDFEGYVFPETYRVSAGDSVSVVLQKSFDQFEKVLQENDIKNRLAAKGLSLHQGITLASIIQQEVSNPADQKQVAQVFLKRLSEDMMLGSDVTFFYAAKKEGRAPSVDDPSPYNTRRVKGLPPGPIANFNLTALLAVVDPTPGDYLYFVAGDGADAGTTFYARTEAEHNDNVKKHCHELCQ